MPNMAQRTAAEVRTIYADHEGGSVTAFVKCSSCRRLFEMPDAPDDVVSAAIRKDGWVFLGYGQWTCPKHRPPIFTIGLEKLMAAFEPAWGGSWPSAIEEILDDPLERDRVLVLADELQTRGHFDKPVRLDYRDPDDCDYARVGNGMHRICAHVLTAHTDVKATFEEAKVDEWLELTWTSRTAMLDEAFERSWSMGSFRLDPDHWVECDAMSSSDMELSAMVYGVPNGLAPQALARVTERFRSIGLDVDEGSYKLVNFDDLD